MANGLERGQIRRPTADPDSPGYPTDGDLTCRDLAKACRRLASGAARVVAANASRSTTGYPIVDGSPLPPELDGPRPPRGGGLSDARVVIERRRLLDGRLPRVRRGGERVRGSMLVVVTCAAVAVVRGSRTRRRRGFR